MRGVSLAVVAGSLLMTALSFAAGAPAKNSVTEKPETPWHFAIYPVSVEARYERNQDQQYVIRTPVGLAVGVGKGEWTVLLEGSTFGETTGNAADSIERTHQELNLWYKQVIHQSSEKVAGVFVGLGAGGYREIVETTLLGNTTKDTSGFKEMGGLNGGIELNFLRVVNASAEVRLMTGKNFDPDIQPGLLLRAGVKF